MTCGTCGKALSEATSRRRYCGPACRAKAWRAQRERAVAEALDQAEQALTRARRAALKGRGPTRTDG